MGKKPDFRVFVSTERDGNTYYHEVGAAWRVANDGISIKLHALPVDGSLVLFPLRAREEDGA